jgi:probable phosphoglycerate mutase
MPLELKPGVTLYLSRHGQTEANVAHRFSGKLDTPLTPKGRAQAHHIGELLKREVGVRPKLDFVASPLRRAQLTASPPTRASRKSTWATGTN